MDNLLNSLFSCGYMNKEILRFTIFDGISQNYLTFCALNRAYKCYKHKNNTGCHSVHLRHFCSLIGEMLMKSNRLMFFITTLWRSSLIQMTIIKNGQGNVRTLLTIYNSLLLPLMTHRSIMKFHSGLVNWVPGKAIDLFQL